MNVETLAYVYKWTHLPTLMWYVGSRTAEGCYPDDGYICSSKTVKPMILESKSEWKREVIATGTSLKMYELETEILQLFNARNDQRSFNKNNNDGIPSNIGVAPWNKGITTGIWINNGFIEKRLLCKNIPTGFKQGRLTVCYHNKFSNTGTKWYNNGIDQGMFTENNAPKSWSEGRISEKRYYHNGSNSKKFIPGTEPNGFVSGRLIAKRRTRAEIAQVLQ